MNSINKDIYRMSTIGECLIDSLTDLQEKGIINEDLKNYTLNQFDTVHSSPANTIGLPQFSKQPQPTSDDYESDVVSRLARLTIRIATTYGSLMPIGLK
jgi:hypothetical protein